MTQTQPHPLCTKPDPHGAHGFMSPARAIACPGTPPARDAAERPHVVTGKRVIEALIIGGVIDDGEHVSRVIIDIRAHEVPVIHVERVGDERLLSLVRTLDEVRVERTPVAERRPVGFQAARSAIVERRPSPDHKPQSAPGRRFPPEVTA